MKQNDKQIPVILIVDDVEVNARLLKRWLKNGISGADCNRRKRGGQSDAERTSAADLAGYYDAGYERLPVLRIIKKKIRIQRIFLSSLYRQPASLMIK